MILIVGLAAGALAAQDLSALLQETSLILRDAPQEPVTARNVRMLTYTTTESINTREKQIDPILAAWTQLEDILYDAMKKQRFPDAFDPSIKQRLAESETLRIRAEEVTRRANLLREEVKLLDRSKQIIEATPACHALFVSTIDKKTSDITVRESELMTACKSMGIYEAPHEGSK